MITNDFNCEPAEKGKIVNTAPLEEIPVSVFRSKLNVRFYTHFHPFVDKLAKRLAERSIKGLQEYDTEYKRDENGDIVMLSGDKPRHLLYEEMFKKDGTADYKPNTVKGISVVDERYPVKELDFSSNGAYSVYNWELFYHVPITVGIHLSRNHRFEDAQRWFHYLFDPTDNSDYKTPDRFWKVKPFRTTDVELIQSLIEDLGNNGSDEQRQLVNSIQEWMDTPFRPHVIARYRQSAYMYKAVMAYLDNLIAWGDNLFRQDTGESINEAMQLYVLAANLLGPRPQIVPKDKSMQPMTYRRLKSELVNIETINRDMENDVLASQCMDTPTRRQPDEPDVLQAVNTLSFSQYFCVPHNSRLLEYWDTVADRLFKIRNSLNFHGVFRQLALFEPPIDPALLARAAAAGLDISAIISGLSQPLPLVRFRLLVQKASEICQEVKSLGSNLLSAMEKEDNEALSILRAKHERVVLGLAESVKYGQWQEAIKAREGLEIALASAAQRYAYYEQLLGADDIAIPELDEIDSATLEDMKLKVSEPEMGLRNIDIDMETEGGRRISKYETKELEHLKDARKKQEAAAALEIIASAFSEIPQFAVDAMPYGVGGETSFGGVQLSKIASIGASATRMSADQSAYKANKAAKMGGYKRREEEWAFQSNLVAGEITQTFKQLRAAQIREVLAEREWKNHQQQIKNSEEIELFLTDERKGKKANKDLYTWMKREVKGLYGQCYEFAYDVAKKAEVAVRHELGDPDLSFLKFDYLEGKEGLLSGEKLYLDIKRMEMAYHDLNEREYELTKHVSLLQLDPMALMQLRNTGVCDIELPEWMFDLDCPGHYFRRIKSVAVSIPCVTGPYTTVNCTLNLQSSEIRTSTRLSPRVQIDDIDPFVRNGTEDDRFSSYRGKIQAIVTSTAQGDSGLFETNLNDERYLPFEGSGVISKWRLELPANPNENDPQLFDYDTISDVILHIRYTAREGGQQLRETAKGVVKGIISQKIEEGGHTRLFSVRHEFPTAWAAFKSSDPVEHPTADYSSYKLGLSLGEEHYPFWCPWALGKDFDKSIDKFVLVSKSPWDIQVKKNAPLANAQDGENTLVDTPAPGLSSATLSVTPEVSLDDVLGEHNFYFTDKSMDDLWIAVTWGVKPEPTSSE